MTTSSKIKRLEKVEAGLSPKEWVIRLAKATREKDFGNKAAMKFFDDNDPFGALEKQAEQKHPGNKPEDISAKRRLHRELWTEFHALKMLLGKINKAIGERTERAGLEAALKISTLQTVILQDAFGRTAKKAAEWIDGFHVKDKDEEQERKIMLAELKAYMDVDFGEKYSDSIRIGDMKLRFPTIIETWIKEAVRLIRDLYAHEAAIKMIQDQFFDGHPIMIPEVEAGIKRARLSLEDAAESFNEYLKVRTTLFKAEWDFEEKHDGGIATAIPGEREGSLKINLANIKNEAIPSAKMLAKEWSKDAKAEAVFDIGRQWNEDPSKLMREFMINKGIV
jgi:hypothetical protein